MTVIPSIDSPSSSQRRAPRESYFLMATLRAAGGEELGKARVRNLSTVGLMADFARRLVPGTPLHMDLRGIGTVAGTVSWSENGRIGIAFDREIDPALARSGRSSGQSESRVPTYLKSLSLPPSGRRA